MLQVGLNSFGDDGKDDERTSIDCYEPNLNIQYIGIKDTIEYLDKNKTRQTIVISNIAIYDIANNKTNYVFKDTLKHKITGFYFESRYIEEQKTIEFNSSFNEFYRHSNNINVSTRTLSNNLIIVTEDLLTKNVTFWLCDKLGNITKKELEITKDWNWEIDVKNRLIRTTRQVKSKIEIQNIKY